MNPRPRVSAISKRRVLPALVACMIGSSMLHSSAAADETTKFTASHSQESPQGQIDKTETQESKNALSGKISANEQNSSSKVLYGKVGATQLPGTMQFRVARPETRRPEFELNTNRMQASVSKQDFGTLFSSISKAAKRLSNYNIELVVDRSMSMRKRDCPGGESRWEWCGLQSEQLSRELVPYASEGITITPFAGSYSVYEHQNPQQISNLFEQAELQFGTKLAEPLADRLNSIILQHNSRSKPTIIAVITDGIPHPAYEPQLTINVLIEASRRMIDPKEITVVFFQIGGQDKFGSQYLQALDNNLVGWGAKCDFVHTVSFDHLQQVGLARALVDSIEELDSQHR